MMNSSKRFVLILLLAVVGIAIIVAALGSNAAPPALTAPLIDFSSASYHYDDGLWVHYIPHSQDPATYTATYEILRSIPGTNHTDLLTFAHEEGMRYENVSASSPIVLGIPGEERSRYYISIEIRDTPGRVVHNSSLSVVPADRQSDPVHFRG